MLEVTGLHAAYGQAAILFDVGLQVGSHEVVALIGRNGAGKSTTLKSIAGLLAPKQGEIRFEGQQIGGLEPFMIARRGLGYVPEDRRIFKELTVLENLEVGRLRQRSGHAAWAPERLFELFPNLAERRFSRAGGLSGGEQQMLTIARTLMGNPKAILLDEPSEGLAPIIIDKIAETILDLRASGMAIVLCEQNMHFASAVAERVYIIEKGHIRHEGSMAGLLENEELCATYLAL